MTRNLALAVILAALAGCAGRPPREDYTLANAALAAARAAQAPRFAPGLFTSAEEAYRKGQRAYDEGHFAAAETAFEKAIHFAEQAENYTVLKKAETGESN